MAITQGRPFYVVHGLIKMQLEFCTDSKDLLIMPVKQKTTKSAKNAEAVLKVLVTAPLRTALEEPRVGK